MGAVCTCCASESYDRIEPEAAATPSYNVCLVGPCAVGKTALIYRYFDGCFVDVHASTIGLDMRRRRMRPSPDAAELVLTCFDTCSSQERFRNGGGVSIFNRMHAIVLVYSAAEPEASLRQLLTVFWRQIEAGGHAKRPVLICRNKSDLAAAVEKPEAALLAELTHVTGSQHVVHTSAKSGDGLDELFDTLVALLVNQNKA